MRGKVKKGLGYLTVITLLIFFVLVNHNSLFAYATRTIKESRTENFGELGNSQIDWGEFWSLFNQHSDWDLEYNTGPGWISDKSQLQVLKNYTNVLGVPKPKNESSQVKISLNFTADYSADYRLTFGIDLKVKNYLHVNGQYNYSIEYDEYKVFFDWSDLLQYPSLVISHGVKLIDGDNYFWFRIRKNNVGQGQNFVLDPTFGEEGTGDAEYTVGFADYWKGGSRFELTEAGTIQNITLWFQTVPGSGQGVTCGIYDIDGLDDPDTLQGETNERDGDDLSTGSWETFVGNDFPLGLSAGNYCLAFSSDSGSTWKTKYEQTSTSWICRNNDPPPMASSWGSTNKISDDHLCIYATYTVAGVNYVVDLSLPINQTQTKTEQTTFNVVPTYGLNLTYAKDLVSSFGVYPSTTLDYTFTKSIDTTFNVVLALSITHNYLLEVIHTIAGVAHIVDLSLSISYNFTLEILTGLQYFVSSALSMSPQFSVEAIPAVSEYELFNEMLFGNGAWFGILIIAAVCLIITHYVKYASIVFSIVLVFVSVTYLNNSGTNLDLIYMALICWIMIPFLLFIEARRLKKG